MLILYWVLRPHYSHDATPRPPPQALWAVFSGAGGGHSSAGVRFFLLPSFCLYPFLFALFGLTHFAYRHISRVLDPFLMLVCLECKSLSKRMG